MHKITNKSYLEELRLLQDSMIKAEVWAEKLPLFKDIIIERKLNGTEQHITYTKQYKAVHFGWGINRGYYKSDTNRYMINNKEPHQGYFWSIYINTLQLYNSHEKYNLVGLLGTIDITHFDELNTTIYATDEQIERLLELLNVWYNDASILAKEQVKQDEIAKLTKKLEEINNV